MLEALLVVAAPGTAFVYILFRMRNNGQQLVRIARTDSARDQARREAAEEATRVAQHTTDVAMGQTGQALDVVDTHLGELTAYLVGKLEGAGQAPRPAGRHSRPELPADDAPAAITSGETRQGFPS